MHRRYLHLAKETGIEHRGRLSYHAPKRPTRKERCRCGYLEILDASPNIVAIDTAALRLFNQVKKLDMAAVGHIGKGEALKLGTTNLDNVTIKRIKI